MSKLKTFEMTIDSVTVDCKDARHWEYVNLKRRWAELQGMPFNSIIAGDYVTAKISAKDVSSLRGKVFWAEVHKGLRPKPNVGRKKESAESAMSEKATKATPKKTSKTTVASQRFPGTIVKRVEKWITENAKPEFHAVSVSYGMGLPEKVVRAALDILVGQGKLKVVNAAIGIFFRVLEAKQQAQMQASVLGADYYLSLVFVAANIPGGTNNAEATRQVIAKLSTVR